MTLKVTKRTIARDASIAAVVKAARSMWERPGTYQSVGIRDIAAQAGRCTSAIMQNFDSKEALWDAAFPGVPVPVDSTLTRAAPVLRDALSYLLKHSSPTDPENGPARSLAGIALARAELAS